LRELDKALIARLHGQANGDRWRVSVERFGEALAASADRSFGDRLADTRSIETYLEGLHLEDLALACACATGDDEAWEHFVREVRPSLYRAAAAIDPGGGARDLADSLYADLFGLRDRDGQRQSLFRYFHGRSSLATWLRAVLAQRQVDRVRSERRLDPLPEEDSPSALPAPPRLIDPEREKHVRAVSDALARAVAGLDARDRLRLGCYYAQDLTLAETGRLLKEHEATVSRQLSRTRKEIRATVSRVLRDEAGWSEAEVSAAFESVAEDAGALDLRDLLGTEPDCKDPAPPRSKKERVP